MKKFIKLHHYLHNDYKSPNTTILPVLIDIDRIRVITSSKTGSVIWIDNGENIRVLANIDAIEDLLNTKQE